MQIIISFDNLDYFKITNLKLSVGRWFDSHTFIFIVRYITCIFLINVLVNCLTMRCIAALMISGQNSKKARRKTLCKCTKNIRRRFIFVPFFNRNIVNIFFNWHWICEDGNTQTQLSFPSQRFWLVLLLKSLWVAEWNRNPWPGKMQHNYASMLQKATSHNALSDTTCRHNTLHARIQNFFFKGDWVGWVVRWIFEFAGGAYFRLFYYTILNWESSYFLGRPGCTVALTHVPNGVFSPVPSFNWLSDCHIQLLLNRLQYKENPTNQGWSVTSIQHQQIYSGSLLSAVIATLEDALMIKGMINSHSLNLWFQNNTNSLFKTNYMH